MKRIFLIDKRGPKTQLEVAKAVRLSRSMYAQIELGDRNPSVATAKRIAEELDFDWTIFFNFEIHKTCNLEAANND